MVAILVSGMFRNFKVANHTPLDQPFLKVPIDPGIFWYILSTPHSLTEHIFRWCPTYADYFAISSASPAKKGASIHLYNSKYLHAQPNVINISNVPHRVRDFDWLALPGVPRLAVAFGRDVIVFPISVE